MKHEKENIINRLMFCCPTGSKNDHWAVARAIKSGATWETISQMKELNDWPETYVWLKAEMNS